MINFTSKIRLHSPVIAAGECKDGLLFIDSSYRIYKTSKNAKEFIFIKQIFKEAKPLHEYTKVADCNNDHILMSKLDSRIDILLKIENEQLYVLKKLAWQKGYITTSKISSNTKYLATGGEDGRCYIYNNDNYNLHSILPPCPDYISCIVFSKNSKIISYCSYKPQIIIYNLEDERTLANFEVPSVVEDCVFFDNNTKLFFICRNGDTGIYNLETSKLNLKHSYTVWLSCIELNLDENYAYISARNNIFYIHRLENNTTVTYFKIDTNGVNKIKRLNDKIYFCCIDGSVLILDAAKHLSEFLEVCKTNNFTLIHNFANEKNTLLKTLKIYENIRTKLWPDILKKAVDEIQKGNLQEAINLVSIFLEDPKLDLEFKSFIKNQKLINEAMECINNKNYKRVYEIAKGFKQLEQLSFFKNLESEFNKLYELAKAAIIQDPEHNINKAKTILRPFLEIENKKQLIDTLLVNFDKLSVAEKLIKEKNLKEFFQLCKKYSFLKDTKIYELAYQTCSKLFNLALNEVFNTNNNQTDEQKAQSALDCHKILIYLQEIEPFKDQTVELLNLIKLRDQLLEILKNKDYKQCYNFIEKNKELYNLPEVIELDESINDILNRCIEKAYDGEPVEVYKVLKSLIDIHKWQNRIYSIMKISFLYELEKARQKRYSEVNWEKTFYNYVSLFGIDNEIRLFCNDNHLKSVLSLTNHDKQIKAEMLPSILVYKNTKTIGNDIYEL